MKYTEGYKYRLEETEIFQTEIYGWDIQLPFIELNKKGKLTLLPGYACDGPSGPTVDTKTFMRGAFAHDAFYKLMRMGLLPQKYRSYADNYLYKINREDGMSWFRAQYVRRGVRSFASFAANPKNKKKILTAP